MRYINQAIKQADTAEKFGLRPVISNRAYGGEMVSRNKSRLQNNSVQPQYGNINVNNSFDSVKRTGSSIIDMKNQYPTPYGNRNMSVQNIPPNSNFTPRINVPTQNRNNGREANISFPVMNGV